MTEKWRIQRSKFTKENEDKAHTEENGLLYIHVLVLYIFLMVTTCQIFRNEDYNIIQEGPKGNLQNHPPKNKEIRNTRTKKQWNH